MLWQAIGVNIVLADFGTGFSSLRYLRSFQFDQIRIDRSFVQANIDRSFVKDSGLQTSAPRGPRCGLEAIRRGLGRPIRLTGRIRLTFPVRNKAA
jgi:hypothetical protein